MEISDLIKSARIEKGLTQQQLADVVFVTRQTISKWELGKSVPDQASLILLYQYLDIKDNEKKQLSKLIFNKQNIILILIAILFSPMVIGVRFGGTMGLPPQALPEGDSPSDSLLRFAAV